jgi:hypothetical protein
LACNLASPCFGRKPKARVATNSLKEMVHGLPLNFSILLEELRTSMVYMGAEVTTCSKIYGDDVNVGAAIGVPH